MKNYFIAHNTHHTLRFIYLFLWLKNVVIPNYNKCSKLTLTQKGCALRLVFHKYHPIFFVSLLKFKSFNCSQTHLLVLTKKKINLTPIRLGLNIMMIPWRKVTYLLMKLEAVSLILVPNKQSPKLYYCHNTDTITKKKKKKPISCKISAVL